MLLKLASPYVSDSKNDIFNRRLACFPSKCLLSVKGRANVLQNEGILDCEQSLFSQSSLHFLARVTILRDCSPSKGIPSGLL